MPPKKKKDGDTWFITGSNSVKITREPVTTPTFDCEVIEWVPMPLPQGNLFYKNFTFGKQQRSPFKTVIKKKE